MGNDLADSVKFLLRQIVTVGYRETLLGDGAGVRHRSAWNDFVEILVAGQVVDKEPTDAESVAP